MNAVNDLENLQRHGATIGCNVTLRGHSSSVERELPKLERWVRFPLPAPNDNSEAVKRLASLNLPATVDLS